MAAKQCALSVSSEAKKLQERLERFSKSGATTSHAKYRGKEIGNNSTTTGSYSEPDFIKSPFMDGAPFVGTNQQLEKSYLRLTTFPRSEDVRPLPNLIKALEHVKRKYQQNEDYEWCNDQLKSIRQDITVQSIHDHPLVLDVYQTHARVLLEQGDLSEFNQCLTNLLQLYRSPPRHSKDDRYWSKVMQAEGEFRAYSVLYSLIHKTSMDRIVNLRRRLMRQEQVSASSSQSSAVKASASQNRKKRRRRSGDETSNSTLSPVTPPGATRWFCTISEEEADAWKVVRAVEDGNDVQFYRLYATAPHLSPYLMDFLVQRVRTQSYRALMAAHRPTLSLEYLQERLQFDAREELRNFLQQQNVVFASNEDEVDCRQSQLSQGPLK
jgi:SAC3 family protein LENG8/THP3